MALGSEQLREEQAWLAVSEEMAGFRSVHDALNKFWTLTDLAYAHVLEDEALVGTPSQPLDQAMGHLDSRAWRLTSRGRLKLEGDVREFLERTHANRSHLYRATLVAEFAAFEDYLAARLAPLLPAGMERPNWGPYFAKLPLVGALRESRPRLDANTVLRADYCRQIRNQVVHAGFAVPKGPQSQAVDRIRAELQNARNAKPGTSRSPYLPWDWEELERANAHAYSKVIDRALQSVREEARQGHSVDIAYFYMAFTFANLNALALEIEQALQPPGRKGPAFVKVYRDKVRRHDLLTTSQGL